MSTKYIYMVNEKDHAVAILNTRHYLPVFLKMGFVVCSHEKYFLWRWGTWNKTKFAEIEMRKDEKKKTARSN